MCNLRLRSKTKIGVLLFDILACLEYSIAHGLTNNSEHTIRAVPTAGIETHVIVFLIWSNPIAWRQIGLRYIK